MEIISLNSKSPIYITIGSSLVICSFASLFFKDYIPPYANLAMFSLGAASIGAGAYILINYNKGIHRATNFIMLYGMGTILVFSALIAFQNLNGELQWQLSGCALFASFVSFALAWQAAKAGIQREEAISHYLAHPEEEEAIQKVFPDFNSYFRARFFLEFDRKASNDPQLNALYDYIEKHPEIEATSALFSQTIEQGRFAEAEKILEKHFFSRLVNVTAAAKEKILKHCENYGRHLKIAHGALLRRRRLAQNNKLR